MKHFCNNCMKLICVDCIVDHSGHSFVRKEESGMSDLKFNLFSFLVGNLVKNYFNISYLELLIADEKVFFS